MLKAFISSDYSSATVATLDSIRAHFDRRRRNAERFALRAAEVNDKHTSDWFAHEAKLWAEAIDEIATRIQLEAGR